MYKRIPTMLCGLTVLLTGCVPAWGSGSGLSGPLAATVPPNASRQATFTPFQPEVTSSLLPSPSETAASSPSQSLALTPPTAILWISPAVPSGLRKLALASALPLTDDPAAASSRLDISASGGSVWIYALVAPFPSTTDGVSLDEIQGAWSGASSGPFAGRPLWMEESTLAAFTSLWGVPASGSVHVAPAETMLDSAWADRPAWGIIPFEDLEPRWKVLSVDGQSPVHNDFDPGKYPLKASFALQPEAIPLPATNRDPAKLTVLAMTGVTALVRGTADRMEHNGILYPGRDIRDVLRSADITHISNEIPFLTGCPPPDPYTDSLQFCSDPRYIALLEDVGTDVVELTGNHMQDYGSAAMLATIDMYDQRGWLYFGGGRDLADSQKAATIEHNGNKLAFLGCNYAGPRRDWATETQPGSAPCDFDQMHAKITSLRAAGYLPIVTFQYNEYYVPTPTDYEQRDFRSMAEAGAVIVSGSQDHVPAAMEFFNGAFVHYGLGNLFFDQMSYLLPSGQRITDTRREFVDRHVFYGGRYISVELLTYLLEDYARPRPMLEQERLQFLDDMFHASGW